jgi:chromosome partitioning protein
VTAILAVSNRKGGSGKTTTAVNLAAEWGARGRRVLLVDLDTQGHAGLGFGVVARRDEPTAHHVFSRPGFALDDAIRPTASPNVAVAPADPLFDGTDVADRSVAALRRQLGAPAIRARFDLVILDTPPSLDLILVNALVAADSVLIPMIPHALSAEGVRQLTRLFFRVATTVNGGLTLAGLLPVMLNPRTTHHRDTLQEVGTEFGVERLLSGIRSDIQLAEAFASRQPIRDHAPRSRGAADYRVLADELAGLWTGAPKRQPHEIRPS